MGRLFLVVVGMALISTLTGCAGGKSFDYSATKISTSVKGVENMKVTVSVQDKREYVVNGDKYPQYVGTQRSPAYVPWNINTKSGLSMADDFLNGIQIAMEKDGFIVEKMPVTEKESKENIILKMQKIGNPTSVLFTINDWYFDIFYDVRMAAHMKIEVIDASGEIVATEKYDYDMWDEGKTAKIANVFQIAVSQLLNSESVLKALGLPPRTEVGDHEEEGS